MAQVSLKDSGVVFNEENHTYTLKGVALSGITAMLQRQLFPDEYTGISQAVLDAAAAYGTEVHKSCEAFDKDWADNDGTQEVADYINLCIANGLTHERSEYCVTDGKKWASNIDKVYRFNEDTFDLADLKTYGQMTPEKREKARWQLSIYAYMFELQNKKAHVRKLFIMHLRNKQKKSGDFDHIANLIEVQRIPADICKSLLETDAEGGKFQNPYSIPEGVRGLEGRIRELMKQKKEAEDELAKIKEAILADMVEKDQKIWATDTMRITRKYETTRVGYDLKRLQSEHTEIDFNAYKTETRVAGSLTIAI